MSKNLRVEFDYKGYAAPGGDKISGRYGYLWIGIDDQCFTHTTSLRSLRKLRALTDALIKARERSYAYRSKP